MPSLIRHLRDVNVKAISIVRKGANRRRIFLMKSEGDREPLGGGRIVKDIGDDWEAFYIVVAEPNAEEDPGLIGEAGTSDVWASEDEIRKAAWRFMENGGLITKLHESMDPFGQLVENAIAHQDFSVQTPDGQSEMIRKGSWYIAIKPTNEGRALVNSGELQAVSIEGEGMREIAKTEEFADALAWIESREWIQKDAALVPNKPGVTNWVERSGGLPKYIADIAGDLISERGKSTSQAIQLAVGICKNWCSGQGNVKPDTRAKACAAIAEWDAKKASAHVSKTAQAGTVEGMEEQDRTMLQRIGRAVGLSPQQTPAEGLAKDSGKVEDVEIGERVEKLETAFEELPELVTEELFKSLEDAGVVEQTEEIEKRRRPGGPRTDTLRQRRSQGKNPGHSEGRSVGSSFSPGHKRLAPTASHPNPGHADQRKPGAPERRGKGPRRVTVSTSRGSDRLRVNLRKALEETDGELTEAAFAKALEWTDDDGGLEVDFEESGGQGTDLEKQIETIAEGVAANSDADDDKPEIAPELLAKALVAVSADIDKLSEGKSADTDEETTKTKVAKSDEDVLAGIL